MKKIILLDIAGIILFAFICSALIWVWVENYEPKTNRSIHLKQNQQMVKDV